MPEFRLTNRRSGASEDVAARDADGAVLELGKRLGMRLTLIGDGDSPWLLVPLDGLAPSTAPPEGHGQLVYVAADD